jgi:hypothetical protein
MNLRLFRQRLVCWPTWLGWLCLGLAAAVACRLCLAVVYPFLAVTERIPANVLVVEGWVPDYTLQDALAEFRAGKYEHLVTTGGPMGHGYTLGGATNYAQSAGLILQTLGVDTNRMVVAPGRFTFRNRTYNAARSAQVKLLEMKLSIRGIIVYTQGPHARRSRLVYQKVFGREVPIGVVAHPSEEYDEARWWRTSEGGKEVLTEGLGWFFEWLFDSGRKEGEAAWLAAGNAATNDPGGVQVPAGQAP